MSFIVIVGATVYPFTLKKLAKEFAQHIATRPPWTAPRIAEAERDPSAHGEVPGWRVERWVVESDAEPKATPRRAPRW